MELAEYGTLKSLFTGNESHFDINKYRVKLCKDISRGMNYLHKHNPPIIHRDLKSSNILVCRSEDGTPIAKVKTEKELSFELTFSCCLFFSDQWFWIGSCWKWRDERWELQRDNLFLFETSRSTRRTCIQCKKWCLQVFIFQIEKFLYFVDTSSFPNLFFN